MGRQWKLDIWFVTIIFVVRYPFRDYLCFKENSKNQDIDAEHLFYGKSNKCIGSTTILSLNFIEYRCPLFKNATECILDKEIEEH